MTSSGRSRADFVACSYAQSAVWVAERLAGGDSRYHMPFALRLQGALDRTALAVAVESVVDRHPILRARFAEVDGEPRMRLGERFEGVDEIDLAQDCAGDAETGLDGCVRRLTATPFDLERDAPLRATLIRTGRSDWRLLVVAHHIAFDGTSKDVVVGDLARSYTALTTEGPPPSRSPLPAYSRYVAAERARLDTPGRQLPRDWRGTVALAADEARLSDHLARREPQPTGPAAADLVLDPPLRRALARAADAHRVTIFSLLLAGLQLLLSRYSAGAGSRMPVVTIPLDARPLGFRDCAGLFVNEVPVRVPEASSATVSNLVARVQDQLRSRFRLRGYPLDALREGVAPGRRSSVPAGPAVTFGYRRLNRAAPPFAGLGAGYEPSLPSHATRAELSLQLVDDGSRVAGRVEWQEAGLDASLTGQVTDHWTRLLEQIASAPHARLRDIEVLTAQQRRRTLATWNDTAVRHAGPATVPELFEAQAARTPDATALLFEGDEISYAQLDAWASRGAARLRDLGVGPETLVAICAERSPELVAALLAVLKAGAAYVPLDPSYPAERLAFMLADAGAPVLLTQEPLQAVLPEHRGATELIDRWPAGQEERGPAPSRRLTGDGLAYVIYTSGSTGRPKGVMNTHRALRNRLAWMQDAYGLTAADTVLQKTPSSFDVSVWEFLWPLVCGARLVLARPGGHRDGAYLVDLIERARVTTLHFVPSMLRAFLDEPGLERCRSVRRVICSGEELPQDLADRFFERIDADLHNLYGPTEAAIDVAAWRCRPRGRGRVPIGRPIANVRLHVLDDELRPLPAGATGELYIGGAALARGYLRRPDLTADRFVPDPFTEGGRLYRTGDLARHEADGALVYLGRVDQQVKVRGVRVELGEIEAVLGEHPDVARVAVVARDGGRGDAQLVAYVVPHDPARPPDAEQLVAAAARRLPEPMLPASIVVLDSLPLTPSGKLAREALPVPAPASPAPVSAEPATAMQRLVADAWSGLLEVDAPNVDANFFELGGHSILATRAMARLRSALSRDLPLRLIFERPTIRALAEAIQRLEPVADDDRSDELGGALSELRTMLEVDTT